MRHRGGGVKEFIHRTPALKGEKKGTAPIQLRLEDARSQSKPRAHPDTFPEQLHVLGVVPASHQPPTVPGWDHPAFSLPASPHALGLSNSWDIFCPNVYVTEACTEISFPPSPTRIYCHLHSLLPLSFPSLRSCFHPSLLQGRVQGPSGEQGLRGRSCPATQAKGTELKMILAMRPEMGISLLLQKLAQKLLI